MTVFPDIEKALAELLEPYVADADHIGNQTPAVFDSLFIRVNRYGGGDNFLTDQAAVDVEFFAPTRSVAVDAARDVHTFLIGGPHQTTQGLIDLVRTSVGPSERPWSNTKVRRIGASYTVSARRIPA